METKKFKIVELMRIHNPAGNITIVQNGLSLEFSIKRVYYLYDIPSGTERGGHAHKELFQLIIAASGSFTVELDDGFGKYSIYLNKPNAGLILRPGVWREIKNFSSGSICLVLASQKYKEEDYIRDYDEFIKYIKNDPSNI